MDAYVSVILTLLTVITGTLTVITFFRNGKKESNNDSEERGKTTEKLDNIEKCTEEIRKDIKELRSNEGSTSLKLAVIEASCKEAHRRLDRLEINLQSHIKEGTKNVR